MAYAAALPCETLMSENRRLTIKLQCSVATFLGVDVLLITKLGRFTAKSVSDFFNR